MASFPFCDSGPLITTVIVIPAAHIVVTTLNICAWYTSLLNSRYNNTNITYLLLSAWLPWFVDLGQYVRSPLMYVVYVPSSSCSFHCKNSVRELNLSVWVPASRECVGFLSYAVWLPHKRKPSPLLTLLQSRESLPRFSLCCFSQ